MANTKDVQPDTIVVASSPPPSPPTSPLRSSAQESALSSPGSLPGYVPDAYSWSPPVVLGDSVQCSHREGSAGYWIVYLRGANESFSDVVDLVRRVFHDAIGQYLVERTPRFDGRAIVDIWLCFVHAHSVTSVMCKDIWARKGAQGGVIHVEWPRFRMSRKQFFASSINGLFCNQGTTNTEGSFRELMVALQRASDAQSERMGLKRNRVREKQLPRGGRRKR